MINFQLVSLDGVKFSEDVYEIVELESSGSTAG